MDARSMLEALDRELMDALAFALADLTDEQVASIAPAIDLRSIRDVAIHSYRTVLVVAATVAGQPYPPRDPLPETAAGLSALLASMQRRIAAWRAATTPEMLAAPLQMPWGYARPTGAEALVNTYAHGLVHTGTILGIRAAGGFATPPEEPKPNRGAAIAASASAVGSSEG
jgi:hypothetical protein